MPREDFIEIRNLAKVEKLLKGIPNGVERATSSAINRSLVTLKRDIKKEVTDNYGIKASDVEKAMITQKATWTNLRGNIKAKSPLLSLHKFLNSTNNDEIYVLVKKIDGKRKVQGKKNLKGQPFIARMMNGHKGIFQRKEDNRIQELKTLSIPQMLGSKTIMEYIKNSGKVDDILEKNLEREINRILKGHV